MFTQRAIVLCVLFSWFIVQTRIVNYVENAVAVAATTTATKLINSFPDPEATGSDLAATLTENKNN